MRQQSLQDVFEEIKAIFNYQNLPFVLEAILTELISYYHNNPLVDHFGIQKTHKI